MQPEITSALNPKEKKITDHEFDQLVLQAGSVDPDLRRSAHLALVKKWDAVPMVEAPPKEISFSEVLAPYSDEQLQFIAKQCIAIELTEGCNNFCPFCLYRSKGEPVQRGITAKFALRNIHRLITAFAPYLGDGFDFYHFSDVLDTDITAFLRAYNSTLEKEYISAYNRVLTTAVAPGRERELIKLLDYLFSDAYKPDKHEGMYVRLSINDANEERISLALAQFIKLQTLKGKPEKEIKRFLQERVRKEDRRNLAHSHKIVAQGRLVDKKDKYDIATVSCRVGTMLTPTGIKGVCPVATTPFNPAGEMQYPIPPEKVEALTPLKNIAQQIRFETEGLLQFENYVRFLASQTSFPFINLEGEDIQLEDSYQTALLHIGRELYALDRALFGYRAMYFRVVFDEASVDEQAIKKAVPDGLQKRIERILKYSVVLTQTMESVDPESRKYKEASYYKTLSEVFQTKIAILIKAVTELNSAQEWGEVGTLLFEATTPQGLEAARERISAIFEKNELS